MLTLIKLQNRAKQVKNSVTKGFNRFLSEEDAPTMVEYGLLVVAIALVVLLGAQFFGTGLSTLFSKMGSAVGSEGVSI